MRNRVLPAVVVLFSLISIPSRALTILSGPTFTPATNAPLAGRLQVTTDVDSRVSISVEDGTGTWSRDFYDFAKDHSVPLLGFTADRNNLITVTVYDKARNEVTAGQPLRFGTPPLPADFPNLTVLQSEPASMEPGYTLFRVALNGNRKGYETIIDNSGTVVWYSPVTTLLDIRQLENGDLFYFSTSSFFEMNMLGEPVNAWPVSTSFPIDSHDGVPTDHGTILYMSSASAVVTNYPTSTTDPNAPLGTANNVVYQRVVEISATNSALLNSWSLIDMLEAQRITYLTTLGPYVWDSEHGNGLVEDPADNSIIVSLRHQNAVIKFSRTTGQLAWILGPHENWGAAWQPRLLAPIGSPFGWQYGQHSPVLTPWGTLMVYDDGNYRAEPFDPPVPDSSNYSRAVEYRVNQDTMEVTQVWEYGSSIPERLYTDKVGSAEPLPRTGNVLITFGSVQYVDGMPPSSFGPGATMARIKEVTHQPVAQVVFDLAVTEYDNTNAASADCFVYRSYRMGDLYAHPARAVTDLTLSYENGMAHLEFSADPNRSYTVEASTDLTAWQQLGSASEDLETGTFHFEDSEAINVAARFYRVVTH